MMKFTVSDVSEVLGVDKDVAYNLVRFLEARGHVAKVGSRHEPGKRGRGQSVYNLSGETLAAVAADLSTLLAAPETAATEAEVAAPATETQAA